MSPLVALCNHSCDPNAVVVFPNGAGQGMEIIAIREIAQGEEVYFTPRLTNEVPLTRGRY